MDLQLSAFQNIQVAEKFNQYPALIREKLLFLRTLIFKVAAETPGVGPLEETLKWQEPSYIPSTTKNGVAVRIDWKKSKPDQYAIYFHCKTTLVMTFQNIYGDLFKYEGNRAILFSEEDVIPVEALSDCIARALSYYLVEK